MNTQPAKNAIRNKHSWNNHQQLGSITSMLLAIGLIAVSVLFIAVIPARAGDQYMAGSPELSVSIAGTNEFSPGRDVQIAITVENSGLNEFKFVKSGIVSTDDLPNTAKFLTMTLGAGNSPLIIKSDPQMIGDLKASSTAKGLFTVRIPSDTPAGSYFLPVILNYTYLYTSEQYGSDTVRYNYKNKEETFSIPLKIRPDVRVQIVSSTINDLNAGREGSIILVVKNIGHEDANKAILTIARNDGSPVIPTEGSAYIGNFGKGATTTATFKAAVSSSANAQSYPIDVYVKYENHEGDSVMSDIETIGVPVGKKTAFSIVSESITMIPGEKKIVTVQYRNDGDAVARQAQARISMVDPFTSNDDTAFLGDLGPGQTKEASFLITVDKSATPKQYGIDSEVQYRDAFDNQIVSDPIKVGLTVTEDTGFVARMMKNPLSLGGFALIILVIGYIMYRTRQNR